MRNPIEVFPVDEVLTYPLICFNECNNVPLFPHVNPNDSSACTYEIIHAYGVTPYVFPGTTKRIFSRKVIVTREDIGIPTGFGRIKALGLGG